MAITKNMLVTIILSIFFIVSSVHCSDRTLGYGINQDFKKCFPEQPCGDTCRDYCQTHIGPFLWHICENGGCCCTSKINI
ncbi:hypothetical protein N665_0320s0079 [Sinapis alba]|nr:hypothetical protein N665_0320s0079 [Sinapis alba]